MMQINKIIKIQKSSLRALLCFSFLAFGFTVHAGNTIPSSVPLPLTGITPESFLRGILGMAGLLLIGWLMSRDRRSIDWKVVIGALAVQMLLAVSVMYIPGIQQLFGFLGKCFVKILDFTRAGSIFLFGSLVDMQKVGHIFVFQVLPAIIFFAALTHLLYYLNVIQWVVRWLGRGLHKIFRLSGAEGATVAGNIFLGMCEAPLLVKGYLSGMNKAEIFLVMTSGMATIAGGVMTTYIGMLGGSDPVSRELFAKYLITASVMAAPGAVAFARMVVPQTELSVKDADVKRDSVGNGLLDALSNGTLQGVRLAVNVAALLLVFVACIALVNYLLGGILGRYTGLNEWLSGLSGHPVTFDFQYIAGWIFAPVAWLMGVCGADVPDVAALLGTKTILNEFVAYADFSMLKNAGAFVEEKSIVIVTFALCGFANIGSIGMQIGGIGALAPSLRPLIARYGFAAMVCGALTSCMSATMIGLLLG